MDKNRYFIFFRWLFALSLPLVALSGCKSMTDNPLCDFYGTCEKEESYNENKLCKLLGTCAKEDPLCTITGDCEGDGDGESEDKGGGKKAEGEKSGGATSESPSHAVSHDTGGN